MKQELLDAAKEFNTSFLATFPHVQNPVNLLSEFNTALNQYAQQSTKQGETIHAITTLLSNPRLEAFASEHQQAFEPSGEHQPPTSQQNVVGQEAQANTGEAREVVWGNVDHNLAGLQELVHKLISDLEAARH